MAPVVGAVARNNNKKVEIDVMKRIIATSVIGALVLTAPLAFALDKAAVDSSAKEPAKAAVVTEVKKPEAVKTVTPPATTETVKTPAKDHKATKEVPAGGGKAAPMETKPVTESKAAGKDVKNGIAAEAKKPTEAKPVSTSKTPESQVKVN